MRLFCSEYHAKNKEEALRICIQTLEIIYRENIWNGKLLKMGHIAKDALDVIRGLLKDPGGKP
jgi:hypothetical protein